VPAVKQNLINLGKEKIIFCSDFYLNRPMWQRRHTMKTSTNVFTEIANELRNRKFSFNHCDEQKGSFVAYNPNYEQNPIRVRATRDTQHGVVIEISTPAESLDAAIKNAIMQKYMEHFDVNAKGGVSMIIPTELKSQIDMGDAANIITRAYSLAVTSVRK
jgi:hypothetical protein